MPPTQRAQDEYGPAVLQQLGKRLQAHYDGVKEEPLPEMLIKLMLALEAQGKSPTPKGDGGNNSR
jgi:Anti-sigma factor NepR